MKKDKFKNVLLPALKCAFPKTLPIMAGFLFLGMTYGIYMKVSGFAFWLPMLTATTIFAGSMEFVTVSLLMGAFNPLQVVLMTLMINARHMFYGLSLLDKYENAGIKKLYMIFGLCDETFSINCSAEIPENIDTGWFMFFVTLLDQIYWFVGCSLGGIFGSLITFSIKGLDFVMTAMFVVIFINQWKKDKNHLSAMLGLALSFFCLILFGADKFIIPSMIAILVFLICLKNPIEKRGVGECL